MPRRNFDDPRAFLDLEADVDCDEPEERDVGDFDDFIDDEGPADRPDSQIWYRNWPRECWFQTRGDLGGDDDDGDGDGDGDGGDDDDDDGDSDGDRGPVAHLRTRDEAFECHRWDLPLKRSLQSIVQVDDFPLWRVSCREGIEQEALLCLLHVATDPAYELRSAFTRGSIRGYVYLEATMNSLLVDLLKRTPGIRHGTQGLRCRGVPEADWEALLTMQDSKATPVVGEWVLISRGLYKGDLGLVSYLEDWQGVSVLLIPRIPYSDDCLPSSKRKRSADRPPLQLFDPRQVPNEAHIQPVELRENIYNFGSLRLENGLLRRSFDYHSISQGVLHMPTKVSLTFQESKHSEIVTAKFPCPPEFKFEVDELVTVLPMNTPGKIKGLHECELEVELLNGEGDVSVSWANVQKRVFLGDYAEILSGWHRGLTGFVTAVHGDSVTVTEFERLPDTIERAMKAEVVHVNWVKVIPPPFIRCPVNLDLPSDLTPEIDELSNKFKVPWRKRIVTVNKHGHPMRGSRAEVVDAIRPKGPDSKPHLVVRYERFTPSGQRLERFPYDWVVDAVSGKKLIADFPKDHPFYFENSDKVEPVAGGTQPPNVVSTTPAWSPSAWSPSARLSLSPAWDPSFTWPISVDLGSEMPIASTSTVFQCASTTAPATARLPPAHPLLDPRLVGKTVRASVSGGTHPKKETPVSIVLGQNDEVTIRQQWRNQSFGLLPEWVTVNHPNPTRDNGLLVVIRGDHCGKYVRRIHHYYNNDDRSCPIMQLAVVEHMDDNADTLTEERIELPPEDLCQGFETEKEKKANANLMSSLRELARYPPQR